MAINSFSKCRINPRLIVTLVAKKNYDILNFMINNTSYSTMICLDCEPSFLLLPRFIERIRETLDVIAVPISWVTPLPEIWGDAQCRSTDIQEKSLH